MAITERQHVHGRLPAVTDRQHVHGRLSAITDRQHVHDYRRSLIANMCVRKHLRQLKITSHAEQHKQMCVYMYICGQGSLTPRGQGPRRISIIFCGGQGSPTHDLFCGGQGSPLSQHLHLCIVLEFISDGVVRFCHVSFLFYGFEQHTL